MQPFITRITLAVLAAAVFTACATVASTPPAATTLPVATAFVPTPPAATQLEAEATAPVVTGDAAIKAAIQTTLDDYSKAWSNGDIELLKSTIDPKSGAFRRLVVGRFEVAQESALRTVGNVYQFTVTSVKPRDFGFVAAEIDSGYTSNWTFREIEGRWLLSEPTEKQVGKRVTQESKNFTFYTYPWADGVNAGVMELMEEARAVVEKQLGGIPEKKALVTILPTFGIGSPQSSGVLAYYSRTGGASGLDRIVIYAPDSFAFGGYDPAEGWQPSLRQTLIHEYTHLVNDRSFTPMYRIPVWMSEGLAEYVSESSRAGEVATAIERDAIIPLIDPQPENPTAPQDLQHMGILTQDVSLAYGLSYSLVAYIAETYGGLDGFWKLAVAYDKRQNLPAALEDAFGVPYETFDREWRAWLVENY